MALEACILSQSSVLLEGSARFCCCVRGEDRRTGRWVLRESGIAFLLDTFHDVLGLE